jgi:YidC/Oxa1 family membrane protein insertase
MLALPFIFVPFILNFQAGLILYWITTNFWTLGQSFVVKWLRVRQGDPVLTGDFSDMNDDAIVAAGGTAALKESSKSAPPPPPRQKKKRSGRRR